MTEDEQSAYLPCRIESDVYKETTYVFSLNICYNGFNEVTTIVVWGKSRSGVE